MRSRNTNLTSLMWNICISLQLRYVTVIQYWYGAFGCAVSIASWMCNVKSKVSWAHTVRDERGSKSWSHLVSPGYVWFHINNAIAFVFTLIQAYCSFWNILTCSLGSHIQTKLMFVEIVLKPQVWHYGRFLLVFFGGRSDHIWTRAWSWCVSWTALGFVHDFSRKPYNMLKTFEVRNRKCNDWIMINIWSELPSLTVWSEFREPAGVLSWTDSLEMN